MLSKRKPCKDKNTGEKKKIFFGTEEITLFIWHYAYALFYITLF